MVDRRAFLAGALAASGLGRAQGAYPERAVRFIVPNPPGGPSDLVARLLADGMRGDLGQSIVVENRPGASALIGTAAAASAPADGYTVLVTSRTNHVVAPLVQKSTQVDPARDLVPVGLVLRAVGLLVTHGKAPFRTLKDFIAQAKANPELMQSIMSMMTYGNLGQSMMQGNYLENILMPYYKSYAYDYTKNNQNILDLYNGILSR